MNNYVFTLETKVKSQDEEINKLKESNEELNGSNRMMSSRSKYFPRGTGKDQSVPLPKANELVQ